MRNALIEIIAERELGFFKLVLLEVGTRFDANCFKSVTGIVR